MVFYGDFFLNSFGEIGISNQCKMLWLRRNTKLHHNLFGLYAPFLLNPIEMPLVSMGNILFYFIS